MNNYADDVAIIVTADTRSKLWNGEISRKLHTGHYKMRSIYEKHAVSGPSAATKIKLFYIVK